MCWSMFFLVSSYLNVLAHKLLVCFLKINKLKLWRTYEMNNVTFPKSFPDLKELEEQRRALEIFPGQEPTNRQRNSQKRKRERNRRNQDKNKSKR